MLDIGKLFQNDRELYDKCGDNIYKLLRLCRINDYIQALKSEMHANNVNIDLALLNSIGEIPYSIEIIRSYYTKPTSKKELNMGQIYCFIKDDNCNILTTLDVEWIIRNMDITTEQYLDKIKEKGYKVTTLAKVYLKDVRENYIHCSIGKNFRTLDGAAKWCCENRYSSGNFDKTYKYLNSKLDKGTAYGMTWTTEQMTIPINYDKLQYKIYDDKNYEEEINA